MYYLLGGGDGGGELREMRGPEILWVHPGGHTNQYWAQDTITSSNSPLASFRMSHFTVHSTCMLYCSLLYDWLYKVGVVGAGDF